MNRSWNALTINWVTSVGRGVIDCAVARDQGVVVAGDVTGTITVMDEKGSPVSTFPSGMPVWGIDISHNGQYIVGGSASKAPAAGRLTSLWFDGSRLSAVSSHELTSPVWDVAMLGSNGDFVSTTWGNGLVIVRDMVSEQLLDEEGISFFGISALRSNDGSASRFFVVAGGTGIYVLESSSDFRMAELLLAVPAACYNVTFDNATSLLVCGSESQVITSVDVHKLKSLRISLPTNSIASCLIVSGFLLLGDLHGNLYCSSLLEPSIIAFRHSFGSSIWNLSPGLTDDDFLVACGDGSLYCCDFPGEFLLPRKTLRLSSLKPEVLKDAKVFISYAREDRNAAITIYEALKDAGCDPWLDDYKLLPGQDWKFEIAEAISKSDFVLLCLSERSVAKRGYVQKELLEALAILELMPAGSIFAIPVRLDECRVPSSLASRHYVDAFSSDGLHKLLLAMQTQLLRDR